MLVRRRGRTLGLLGLVALLLTLATTHGLTALGWAVGLGSGLLAAGAVGHAMDRHGHGGLGRADQVTLTRAMLSCAVAALVADSYLHPTPVAALLALAVTALTLDAVDGTVARRTQTVSAFGTRFDGEVDAFLILALSVYVASSAGPWVLAIGAARYLLGIAGWWQGWLRARLPVRYWRKVVAAIQGIVLVTAAAQVLPRPLTLTALALALALLAESFGRDVVWLWRHRSPAAATVHAEGR